MKRLIRPTFVPILVPIWQRWLARRLPPSPEITLSHRSIFILPSGFGLVWLGLVLLLYLFGTNYQNNLVIGLSILLLSLFNTCILYSYKNLAGLHLRAMTPPEVYAGETLTFPVLISTHHSGHNIQLNYPHNRTYTVQNIGTDEQQALVPFEYHQRGQVSPGRLKIESFYPLGLCRAWSHVDLAISHLVFAQPIEAPLLLEADHTQSEQDPLLLAGKHVSGIDEFKGLKPHVLGESLKQVAWKQWAQGRGMLSKEFQQPQGDPVWLRLRPDAKRLETQLSQLSWQINKLTQLEQYFGLHLQTPMGEDILIAPSIGHNHRIACHKALALYPKLAPSAVNSSSAAKHSNKMAKTTSKQRHIPTSREQV
ncbi:MULTISPECIES: DUF58 domain-containing protein [Shewanella]|uniref:Uncharacterized protein n=1 Tax=Shewanella baltica (strain OS195) TaxID=399599 RepID=A9L0I6_SHEB9|nr:DUF58 domain-containing protein [Shewanella baltica]ABS08192.1 protein of unknown function DUF58 [Shewanella baltica OS185]ABX49266.1 protein of unknown function DUF58 [Shewanella baltica OS195]ADT94256.1 protein of unknown function DUF58 [Shewanella baltica OS678]EHC04277.1 protein of unknown function DUF58 [Shewanella baltica OS625]